MLDPKVVMIPSRRVAFRRVGEQVVVVSPDDNVMLTLNPTGSVAWEALDGQRTVAEISAVVSHEFDVTLEQATQDVVVFFEVMLQRKLLEVGSVPG